MRHVAVLVLVGALVAVAFPASSAGSATVRDCNHKIDFNLKITSARNMRCRAARRVMRRHNAPIARHFDAPNGFHCDLVEGRPISGIWRCTRGVKAFRFDFAD